MKTAFHGAAAALLFCCGCNSTAGMFCQQNSDCRTGLLCAKSSKDGGPAPGTDAAAAAFGVCEAARRGLGETCLWSSECQASLFCSNQIGQFLEDLRHGTCQVRPARDLSLPDLGDGGIGDGPRPNDDLPRLNDGGD